LALCSKCLKRDECKSTCEAVEKEISGRYKTASPKPKTYPVDFAYIEDAQQKLNQFQKDVLHTIMDLSSDMEEKLIAGLTLGEAEDRVLSNKEKRILQLFKDRYTQDEIARRLHVSQPRVNSMLNQIKKKLKTFLIGL
jgi:RNA polymerase sigma factor (sigma-70 family)